MPTDPEPKPTPKSKRSDRKRPYAKPVNDGFVVFYVDGFAQMTPEQRKWPRVTPAQMIRGTMNPPPEPGDPEKKAGE